MTTTEPSIVEIVDNLIEEERGEENHSELWLRFGEALGLSREAMTGSEPLPETEHLVETYREVTKAGSFAQAAATLYCYESQVPEIARQRIAGLRQFYGFDEPRGLQFFTIHIEADEWHAEVGRNSVARYGASPKERDAVQKTAKRCLDGVYEAPVAAGAAG
jgi:pyrroloquinoline-quinone synthase